MGLKLIDTIFGLTKATYGRFLELVKVGGEKETEKGEKQGKTHVSPLGYGRVTRGKWVSRVTMEGYGEDSGRTFLSSRVKSFSDLLQRPGHGWGPWKPIPPPLCVNTESLAAIKAIPARYLTAFKMVQSCESAKTPSFHDVVFHFPPFHIDFRGTMKFLTEAVVQLAPTKRRGGRERRRRRGKKRIK